MSENQQQTLIKTWPEHPYKIRTNPVRIAFPRFLKPAQVMGSKDGRLEYSATLLIPKYDEAMIKTLKRLYDNLLEENPKGWNKAFLDRIAKNWIGDGKNHLVKDGDSPNVGVNSHGDKWAGYEGCYAVATRQKQDWKTGEFKVIPKFFGRSKQPATQEDCYAGSKWLIVMELYPYDASGTGGEKGFGLSLLGGIFHSHDKPFSARGLAGDEFDEIPFEEDEDFDGALEG